MVCSHNRRAFSRERSRYRTFYAELHEPQKDEVRKVVDFFNDLAHLMRNKSCAEKLWPWWIKGVRGEQQSPYLYETFDLPCRYVLAAGYAERGRGFPLTIEPIEVAKRIKSTN